MKITYLKGDALEPVGDGDKIIVHCVNCQGVMGAGIAASIRKKWPKVFNSYGKWCSSYNTKRIEMLGNILNVEVAPEITVCNLAGQFMCGDERIGDVFIPAVDYRAVHKGFAFLKTLVRDNDSLHMGRICCGLAGGRWEHIEEILQNVFGNTNLEIFVYDPK